MATINKAGAQELGVSLHDAANLVGGYLVANFNVLTSAQRAKVRDSQWTLFDLAEEAEQRAIGTRLTIIEGGLETIKEGIDRAKEALKTIRNVGNTVVLVSSIIDLALALNSASPQGILKGLQGISEAIDSFGDEPDA